MEASSSKQGKFERISALFLRRRTVAVCVFAILTTCLVAGYYVQAAVTNLRSTHQSFNDRQLRNGYIAISDLHRLVLIIQEASLRGVMTDEAVADFRAASDFLFVRTDTFRQIQSGRSFLKEADDAIDALLRAQSVADEAIATDFRDLDGAAAALIAQTQTAREALVVYLDKMRQLQDGLLLGQTSAVENQRTVVWVTLLGLSVLGIAATALLRKEVMAKQARREAEERVRHLAFFDPLTGLPNRVQFQDRLTGLLVQRRRLALLLVDLDGFKQINDTYGHAAGDDILRHVAATLTPYCSSHDGFAARLGGDEFAVVCMTQDVPSLMQICDAIITAIARPIVFEGESVAVAASIGLATKAHLGGEVDLTVDGLTRVADFALYASKSDGKGKFTIYDEVLERQFLERRAMVEELPQAIADGSLEYYLQPKVDLVTEEVFGFEALARWRRNDVIVPPSVFISTAEESGIIADIDCTILSNATRDIADFNRRNGTRFSVSVNFSTLHFNSLKFVETVAQALIESGLESDLLVIEITETAEMQDWDKAKQIVSAIHSIGAKVSIDDFGAGFSSLAYLRTTVADEIKIDRSLVQDIETSDAARFLLDAVLDIARNLGLDATVEGIETRQQADIVLAMGARKAQGFFFDAPMPRDDALASAMASARPLLERPAS
ncbi:EAL domain-containing protein [Yoonia sp. F2084L]|uniref:putative bifunctional diguanylate cyclase/phosphodiesterase n=1 Tax=Yoonia sp. F2084L TaxID=2926419 RepID=UPI001FF5DDB3|nr:EAL domain-containing protein [Yoonia sp. F2084L]MCK0096768.1 EAL domain-containing protein [Yoonia sp. F2084L]